MSVPGTRQFHAALELVRLLREKIPTPWKSAPSPDRDLDRITLLVSRVLIC
jgi:hypothetical protein